MPLKAAAIFALLLPMIVAAGPQDLETEHYRSIPQACIASADPYDCLTSSGYVCNRLGGTAVAVAAYRLSCNADMSNGRKHFAQLLYDGVGWAVETQEVYVPDSAHDPDEPVAPDLILDTYLRGQTSDSNWFGGGISIAENGRSIVVHIENSRGNKDMEMRALCGLVLFEEPRLGASSVLKDECQSRFLRTIMMFSQPDRTSPFRAAGANELRWSETRASLRSGDSALILEARYDFPRGHVSCRLQPSCCSRAGSIYLDSCREPSQQEEAAVNECLATGLKRRSVEYNNCLRSRGTGIGCEEQDDGSRLCF